MIIILYFIFYILYSPLVAQAALVPCQPGECTFCDLMRLGKNIIDFMMHLVFPLAAVMIVVGGIMIMIAAGSTDRIAKGKQIITAAIVGLLIALLSWLIIDTILKVITGNRIGPWNELNCQFPSLFKNQPSN